MATADRLFQLINDGAILRLVAGATLAVGRRSIQGRRLVASRDYTFTK
jgi:hypothetical protein